MASYCKHGTIKVKCRTLTFHAQKSCFGTTGGPLDCLSAKLKNFMAVVRLVGFHEIHICQDWRLLIFKFLLW